MPSDLERQQGLLRTVLPPVLMVFVIVLMVAIAERSGENEVIFPEIAAIAMGYLLAPKRTWQTDSLHILVLIALGSWLGLGIAYLPLPHYWQILLGFLLAQVIYSCSGTTFAPMVSAIVLPIVLQTKSVIYPIAAILLTVLILLLRRFLEAVGIRGHENYSPLPLPDGRGWAAVLLRIACVAVLAIPALRLQWTYAIAPPLLVAFTEFSRPGGKARRKPISAVLMITMCALAGASSRMLIHIRLGLPLALAALCASALLLLIIYIFGMYLPPAGAAAILAMLIPESALLLYPVQIVVGASILMTLALLLFPDRHSSGTAGRASSMHPRIRLHH